MKPLARVFRSFGRGVVLATIFSLGAGHAHAGMHPDLAGIVRPVPEPAYPAGFDAFVPPVDAATGTATGTPTLTTCTPIGKPDDTLVLTGEQLSTKTGADAGKDTYFDVFGQTVLSDGTEAAGLIQRLDGREVAVTLPTSLPANSMYLVWPYNANGYGRPLAVNRTEAWWLGLNTRMTNGATVAVYGRNLSHNAGTNTTYVFIKPVNASGQWATVTEVNPYRVAFRVPGNLTNGTYEVWMHNGHGGSYGWSGPLYLPISSPYVFTGTVFNVKSAPYNAIGDGIHDDTANIQSALDAANAYLQGNPTACPSIYLPTGNYMISGGFPMYSNLRWYGDGRDNTFIKCNAAFPTPGGTEKLGMFWAGGGSANNMEIRDMTLDANGNITAWNTNSPNPGVVLFLGFSKATDLRLINVRVKTLVPGVSAGNLGADGLTVENCEIYNDLHIGGTQGKISGCNFLGANDCGYFIFVWQIHQLAMLQNTFRDYDINSTNGQAQGRVFVGEGAMGSQREMYFGANTTIDLALRDTWPLDQLGMGEQVSFGEGNWVWYKGTPTVATPTTVTFSDLTNDFTSASVSAIIADGTGLGQHRPITGYNFATKTITVSPPWIVPPDATSLVLIQVTTERFAVYGNTFDGKSNYATRVSGSTGVEAYQGGASDIIVDNNLMSELTCALYMGSGWQDPVVFGTNTTPNLHAIMPSYGNYYANNRAIHCNTGIFTTSPETTSSNFEGVAFLGNVFRNNQFTDLACNLDPFGTVDSGIYLTGGLFNQPGKPMHLSVWEHNSLTHLPRAVDPSLNEILDATDLIFYKNSFDLGTATFAGSYGFKFGTNQIQGVRQNTWTGFQTTYAGVLPGAILEVPQRVITIQATPFGSSVNSTLTVWNSGTSPLNWSASSDSTWLTVSPGSGTVADENGSATLTVTASPVSSPVGTYTGTITLTAGTQTKKVTVFMVVQDWAIVQPLHTAPYWHNYWLDPSRYDHFSDFRAYGLSGYWAETWQSYPQLLKSTPGWVTGALNMEAFDVNGVMYSETNAVNPFAVDVAWLGDPFGTYTFSETRTGPDAAYLSGAGIRVYPRWELPFTVADTKVHTVTVLTQLGTAAASNNVTVTLWENGGQSESSATVAYQAGTVLVTRMAFRASVAGAAMRVRVQFSNTTSQDDGIRAILFDDDVPAPSGANPEITENPFPVGASFASTTSTNTPLMLWNEGNQSLSWTGSSSAPWLTLSPASGTVAAWSNTTISCVCNPTGLASGTYYGTVTITGAGQMRTATVRFSVGGFQVLQPLHIAPYALANYSTPGNPRTDHVADLSGLGTAGYWMMQNDSSITKTAPNWAIGGLTLHAFEPGGIEHAESDQPSPFTFTYDGTFPPVTPVISYAWVSNSIGVSAAYAIAPSGKAYNRWEWPLLVNDTDVHIVTLALHVGQSAVPTMLTATVSEAGGTSVSTGPMSYSASYPLMTRMSFKASAPGKIVTVRVDFNNTNQLTGVAALLLDDVGLLPGPNLVSPEPSTSAGSANGTVATNTFNLFNEGTQSLNWSVTSDSTWLTFVSSSGAINAMTNGAVSYVCNPAGLAAGTYTGTATVTSGSQVKTVTVKFHVGAFEVLQPLHVPPYTRLPYPGQPTRIDYVTDLTGLGTAGYWVNQTKVVPTWATGSLVLQAYDTGLNQYIETNLPNAFVVTDSYADTPLPNGYNFTVTPIGSNVTYICAPTGKAYNRWEIPIKLNDMDVHVATVVFHENVVATPTTINVTVSEAGGASVSTGPTTYVAHYGYVTRIGFRGTMPGSVITIRADFSNSSSSYIGFHALLLDNTGPVIGPAMKVPEVSFASSSANGVAGQGTFNVFNEGTQSLNWTATSDAGWLTVSPSSGTLAAATYTTTPVTYTCNPAGLAPGNYTGHITVTAGTQVSTITVTYRVNTPPTVSVTTPTNNQVFLNAPVSIVLTAAASDAVDGTVTNVAFYQGTTLLGVTNLSPYTVTWSNVGTGTYALTARAWDNDGAVTTSSVVSVRVNAPPVVNVTAPVNNQVFLGNAFTNAATATDDSAVTNVNFYRNGILLGNDTTTPYSNVWNNITGGVYQVTARAWDNNGVVTTSSVANLTIWNHADIGNVGSLSPGKAAYVASSATFTNIGAGGGITNTADAFHFIYRQISGNCTAVVKVANWSGGTMVNERAGLMIRQSTNANVREISALYHPQGNQVDMHQRLTDNGTTTILRPTAVSTTPWVRLIRIGNTFTASQSANGTSAWSTLGTTNVTMTDPVMIGLAVTSGTTSGVRTGAFTNLTITP